MVSSWLTGCMAGWLDGWMAVLAAGQDALGHQCRLAVQAGTEMHGRPHHTASISSAALKCLILPPLPQRCEIKKTFSFVEFERLEDAKEACEQLHGSRINGREITGACGLPWWFGSGRASLLLPHPCPTSCPAAHTA